MSDWVVVTYFPVKHLGGFLSTLRFAIAYFGSVPEGEPVRFTLTATPPPLAPLEVSLSWEQTGNWLDGTSPATVTISTDGTAEIETATNDD